MIQGHGMGAHKKADQRRHARFDIVEYTQLNRTGDNKTQTAVIVDLSLSGVQLRSRFELSEGDHCELVIGRCGLEPMKVRGEVRYCHPVENSGLFATGLRFVPKNPRERIELVDYIHDVFQKQGERLIG